MTSREKIDFLKKYKTINNRINGKIEELEMWRDKACRVTPSYSDMPKGGEQGDKIQTAVENIIEIEEQINESIDELVRIKAEVRVAIDTVQDNTLKYLLELRYINGKTFEQIAVDMNYSYMHICRLHGKALILLKM